MKVKKEKDLRELVAVLKQPDKYFAAFESMASESEELLSRLMSSIEENEKLFLQRISMIDLELNKEK